MKERILAAFAAVAIAAGITATFNVGIALGRQPATATVFHSTNTCQEDEACWDWRTMGDHRHGICITGRWFIESADGTITDDNPLAQIGGC